MNILVTGGAGFIGSHVCKLLAAAGHVPVAYDNLSRGHRGAVKWGPLEVGGTGDAARLRAVSAPDVHWMSLRPELEGLLIPSKLYGILAAGRPVIAVTAKRGEIATLVETHGCGIAIEPGEAEALAAAISDLSRDPARCDDMGRRARVLLDQKFSRRAAFEKWDALIEKVVRV